MSEYYNKQYIGELWLKDSEGNIVSGSDALTNVYAKYININSSFYNELTSNRIITYDVVYDTIFVETQYGYIFEKIYKDDLGVIQPFNKLNLLNVTKSTKVDYWFDESLNKIYFTDLYYYDDFNRPSNPNYFEFILTFNSFDCHYGTIKKELINNIKIGFSSNVDWNELAFTMENPKLTYNKDTKTFNISFILRNSKNTLGIVSLNIADGDVHKISEVNGFLPYFTLDYANSEVIDLLTIPANTSNIKEKFLYSLLGELLLTFDSEIIKEILFNSININIQKE